MTTTGALEESLGPGPLPAALDGLPTPSLLLDLDVLERNVETMARRMAERGVALRPHWKTSKSADVAALQRRHGAAGLTVSTLGEAHYLVARGWRDLLWAFPVILNRTAELRALLEVSDLRVLIDSPEAIDALEALRRQQPTRVWLKVDCGYGRAGVDPRGPRALALARRLHDAEAFRFEGILSHSGQAYDARTRAELAAIAEEERRVMVDCAARLRAEGVDCPGVSIGSTPALSAAGRLDGVTEARPGNYVFYDLTQVRLGACAVSDCALTVLASVVSCQPGARHAVIDAGALSLSKDPGPAWVEPPSYGAVFARIDRAELDPELRLVSLSQEHGILSAPRPVGTLVRILPNHACLAVPCFDHYVCVRGTRVVGTYPIWRH